MATALVPRVLAIPVFTLSDKTWEIRFSCSGLARTMIRMFHSVWMATWTWEPSMKHLDSTLRSDSLVPVWSWCWWCSSGRFSPCRPAPSHSKGPPESQWRRYRAECGRRCRLEFCPGPYTETTSWCCGEDRRFLQSRSANWRRRRIINIACRCTQTRVTATGSPMFQVPTNTVIMSGSGFSVCLFFICWSSWQKPSLFCGKTIKTRLDYIHNTSTQSVSAAKAIKTGPNQHPSTCHICYLGIIKHKFFALDPLFFCLHPNNKLDGHLLGFHQLKNWKKPTIRSSCWHNTDIIIYQSSLTVARTEKWYICRLSELFVCLFYFCCAQSIFPLVHLLTSWNTTSHFQHPLSGTSLWGYPEILAWPANHTEYPASQQRLNISSACLVQLVIDAGTSNTTIGMRDFLWPPSHPAESNIDPLACRRNRRGLSVC